MKKYLFFLFLAGLLIPVFGGFSKPIDDSLRQEAVELIKSHPTDGDQLSVTPTMVSMDNYKNKALHLHKNLNKIKSKEVLATVTFKEPISADDLVEFIERSKLKTRLVYLYGKERGQEGYVTTGIFINENDSPEKVHELAVEAIQGLNDSDANAIGFLSAIGSIPHKMVIPMQSDQEVYLVDISADSSFGGNPSGKKYIQHLGYDLYELNGRK